MFLDAAPPFKKKRAMDKSSWFTAPAAISPLPDFLVRETSDGPAIACSSQVRHPPAKTGAKKRPAEPALQLSFLSDTALSLPGYCGRCRVLLDGLTYATPYHVDELCPATFSEEDRKDLLLFVLQSDDEPGWLENQELRGILIGATRVPMEIARRLVRQNVELTARPTKKLSRAVYKLCKPFRGSSFMVTLLPLTELNSEAS